MRCDLNKTQLMLLKHGFDDIQEQASPLPVNNWHSDDHKKRIGQWFNIALTQSILITNVAWAFVLYYKQDT